MSETPPWHVRGHWKHWITHSLSLTPELREWCICRAGFSRNLRTVRKFYDKNESATADPFLLGCWGPAVESLWGLVQLSMKRYFVCRQRDCTMTDYTNPQTADMLLAHGECIGLRISRHIVYILKSLIYENLVSTACDAVKFCIRCGGRHLRWYALCFHLVTFVFMFLNRNIKHFSLFFMMLYLYA